MDSFQGTALTRPIECNLEVLEEPFHAEQSGYGQIVLEASQYHHRAAGNVKRDLVQMSIFASSNTLSHFDRARPVVNAQVRCEVGVKETTACSGVNEGLEALCSRGARGRKRDLHVQNCAPRVSTECVGKYSVRYDQRLQRAQTDNGAQLFGTFRMIGSSTPARSLFLTTSE